MKKINRSNIDIIKNIWIYLLEEPLQYFSDDAPKVLHIILIPDVLKYDRDVLIHGNYYFHPNVSINY